MEPVELYLDGVAAIVERLQSLTPEDDVTLVTPRHESITLEGLSDLERDEIRDLEIRHLTTRSPRQGVLVAIDRSGVLLFRTGDTPAYKRAFSEIEELLLSHRRGWQWRNYLPVLAGVAGPLSAVAVMLSVSRHVVWMSCASLVLAGISLIALAFYLGTYRLAMSKIVLVTREEHRGSWRAYRDQLLAAGVLALATLLISLIAKTILGVSLL